MQSGARFDVSVILPFGDDEDLIGAAILHVATHLRELGLAFEILAIDEDSGDNSHAIIALLRAQVPELRVSHAPGRGRGFDCGIARAQGHAVWLIEPALAAQSLGGFTRAFEHVRTDACDAAVVRGRFTVAHRVRAMAVVAGLRGTGDVYYRRLAKRLAAKGLRLDLGGAGGTEKAGAPRRALTGVARLRAAFGRRKLFENT